MDARVYRFGPFRIDKTRRRLSRGGVVIPLRPKLFDILLLLVESGGRVLTKEELMSAVWPDQFVEENNLTVSVSALRRALGDRQGGREYIETASKRGYRFIAPVREDESEEARVMPASGGASEALEGGSVKYLAVLPLVNEGGDSGLEYLSDGITEGIIISLSRDPELRVMARSTTFRYKRSAMSAWEAGRELGADAVLTGRMTQHGDTIAAVLEMLSVADGSRLWGERYERPAADLQQMQGEIAREISERLRPGGATAQGGRRPSSGGVNSEAYLLYLKGRYFWNKRTPAAVAKSVDHFRRAIEIAPGYAPAYAGLADCYNLMGVFNILPPKEAHPRAVAEAKKALELDPSLSEARATIAYAKVIYEWDWVGAEMGFLAVLEGSPSYVYAWIWYAKLLLRAGRFDEALEALRRAHELDPLAPIVSTNFAVVYYFMGLHDQALGHCREALDIEPDFLVAHALTGMNLERKGEFEAAITSVGKALDLSEGDQEMVALLGYIYARSGNQERARRVLDELTAMSRRAYVSPFHVALVYTGLGETDRAFEWLEKAYEERAEMLTFLKGFPPLESLRPDPRFTDLLRRVGLDP